MRFTASEKLEIIRLVEQSDLPVKLTLNQLNIPKSTFYDWYGRYLEKGFDGLQSRADPERKQWNQIPEHEREEVVKEALEQPEKSPRELAFHITDTREWFISESSVYRILKSRDLITSPTHIVMKAADRFKDPPARVNELWQTDFSYLKVVHWGWYYLTTILDDYSRYIITWELCKNMRSDDVERVVSRALDITGLAADERPKLLSDNGSCYVSGDLKEFLAEQSITHVRGKPLHPQTQGKIERYHRTMKNIIKLEHYYSRRTLLNLSITTVLKSWRLTLLSLLIITTTSDIMNH
jgi:transposase InsO family protein